MSTIKSKLKIMKRLDARLLQARLPKPLYDRLRAKLKSENVTVQDFIEAAALTYLEES